MNKMIKGSLVGATGVAMLMGGFGTYALWSDSSTMPNSSVSSGVLDIAAGDVVWDDEAAGDWAPGSDLMVPGDTVTRTQTFALSGTGKNLTGTVTFDEGGLTSTFTTLEVDVEIISDDAVVTSTGNNNFAFDAPFDTATLTAIVTYTLPTSTSAQVDQDESATLAESTLTIAQD